MHLDTVDMMVEGVPFEWLKKENQKLVCSKLLHDEQQGMYDLLLNQQQTNIAASNVWLLVGMLSNAKENSSFLEDNQGFLIQALPFLLAYSGPVGTTDSADSSLENKRRKILIKTIELQEFFGCFQAYLNRVENILKRTNPNSKDNDLVLSTFDAEKESIDETLQRNIQYAGKRLFDYLDWEGIKGVKQAESRDVIRKLFPQDPYLLPVIPALYSVDVLNIMLRNSRVAKSSLIQPSNGDLDIWSSARHDLNAKAKGAKELYSLIARRFSELFCSHVTAAYPHYPKESPDQKVKRSFFGIQWEEDDLYREETNAQTAPFFRSSTIIKLPICRYRRLVFDIAKTYGLSNKELLDILHKAPNCLYKGTPEWNSITVSHANDVVEVLKVFRKLADPEFYMQDKVKRTNIFKDSRKSLEKAGFTYATYGKADLKKTGPDKGNLDTELLSLLKRYFYYQDVSELLFFMCAPVSLEYGRLPKQPALFRRVYNSLCESVVGWYYQLEGQLINGVEKEKTPLHIRQFRKKVCQELSLDDAIVLLKDCPFFSLSNVSDSKVQKTCRDAARKFLNTYKKSSDIQQNVLNDVTRNDRSLTYLYLGLLRESLNTVCLSGVGTLIRLFLSDNESSGQDSAPEL